MITKTSSLGDNLIVGLLQSRPLPWWVEEGSETVWIVDGEGKRVVGCESVEQASQLMERAAKDMGTFEVPVRKLEGFIFPPGLVTFLPS